MAKVDALSQWEDHTLEIKKDNKGVIIMLAHNICRNEMLLIADQGDSLLTHIIHAHDQILYPDWE